MLGEYLLMSTVFSGYVASERRVLSFSSLAGPNVDFELVSADAERFRVVDNQPTCNLGPKVG